MPLTQVSSRLIEDTLRYVLGANGTSDYTFTGPGLSGAANDPTLTLSRGHTYVFENRNSSGAHPFYIKTSIANGGTNDAYNTGVTNNGGAGGTEIVFTVPHDAPDTLYYQCSSHSSMAGQLNIAGSVADGSITESKLADDAVTADKLANSINSAIAANTAKDLTALSASNLTSGTVPDARFPATLPAASAANLTNVPAANITGTLPAISGANLTNLPASRVNRNLVINGAMNVAQRATSATAEGYATVDRFSLHHGGEDEDCIQSQHTLTSSDTGPWEEGFRHSYHIQNGNQTSGGDSSDFCYIRQKIEGQDIASSGWNYLSASSYITVSFWIKSSVAFNSLCYAQTFSGTDYNYPFETGNLSANTWTKITKTIPGNSNLVFDADNNQGFMITWGMYWGSNFTDNSTSLNAWGVYDSSQRLPDMASTWWTTNDATFEITGVQLEVGDSATDFEHRTFGEELAKCQRYFYSAMNANGAGEYMSWGIYLGSGKMMSVFYMPQPMRTNATVSFPTGTNYYNIYRANGSDSFDSLGSILGPSKFAGNYFVNIEILSGVSSTGGYSGTISAGNTAVYVHFSAEL